ncbi:MAG: porin family protein [Bacteroidales bacterium]
MRINKIIFFCLLLVSINSYGQFYLGARGGSSISSVSFLPTQDEEQVFDLHIDAGLVAKHFDTKYFGFQGELNLTQRGYRAPILDSVFYKRMNTYIELPMFMQMKAQHNNFFVHFNVGFYASVLLESQHGNNQEGEFILKPYEIHILRDNRFDYGIPGGVGFGYNFKWGTLQIDAKYYYGLGDLYNHEYNGNPMRSPARVLNFSVSYLLNISKIWENRTTIDDIVQPEEDSIENTKQE